MSSNIRIINLKYIDIDIDIDIGVCRYIWNVMDIYEPHGIHKPKTYKKYAKIKRKESKHNTKDRHQITREESMRRKEQRTTKTTRKQLAK